MSKNKLNLLIAVVITAVIAGTAGFLICRSGDDTPSTSAKQSSASSDKKIALYTGMYKLWAEHMQYTYSTVDAFLNESPELQPNLDRLLQNQKDLGDAIRPVYGDAAGDKLTELLTAHIKDAVPVLTAAKAGDNAGLTKSVDAWYANAKDIADFLSSANPDQWPVSATEPMMKTHITTTVAYATDILKGNYAQSIKDYQKAYDHMMMMADTLSQGIIAQHPDKF